MVKYVLMIEFSLKDCKKFLITIIIIMEIILGNVSNKSVRDMIIIMPDEVGWIDCNSVSLSKNDMPPFVPPNNPNIPPYNLNIPPYNPNIPGSPEFPNPNNPNVPPSQPDKVPDSDMDVNDSRKTFGWYFKSRKY